MPKFGNPSPLTLGVPKRPRPAVDRAQLETLEEHEAAQSAIEFATLKRQADETMNAALRSAAEAPDPESSQAIFDKATQAVSKLQSPNIRVQNAFSAHVEGSLAGWGEGFARQAKAAQEKRTLDQGKLEYGAALDKGDPLTAAKIAQHMGTIAPEDRAIYDEWAVNAESESAIRRVRGALADGNFARARELAEKARGVLRSVEQKEDLARLEGVVGRADKEGRVQTRIELLIEADKAIGLPAAELFAAIEQIKARYAQVAESPEDLRVTFDRLNAIAKGEPFEADPNAVYAVNEAIGRLNSDSSPQEHEEVRDLILSLAPQIGEKKAVGFLEELGKRLEPAKAYAVKTAVDDLVARGVIDKLYADVIRREAERFVNLQPGPFDPGSVYAYVGGLAVNLPEEARPKEKAPPGLVPSLLGDLKAHGWSKALGMYVGEPERAEAIARILKDWYYPLSETERTQIRAMLDAEYPGPQPLLSPTASPQEWAAAEVVGAGGPATGVYAGAQALGTPLPVVNTDADYEALPSGAVFKDAEGKRYRKP